MADAGPSLVLGPTRTGWPPSLERMLAKRCVVHSSDSRDSFLRHIKRSTPRVIVLYETDERGTPNEPLLRICARYCPHTAVIFVHPGPALRLPSPWSMGPRPVRFVMLSGKSGRQDAERIAEQVAEIIIQHPVVGTR